MLYVEENKNAASKTGDEEPNSRLFRQRLAISDLAPLATLGYQVLDARDAPGPQALGRRAKGVAALAADDADGLQYGLATVAPEHGRVVYPFEARLELRVERRDGLDVNARCGREAVGFLLLRRRVLPVWAVAGGGGGGGGRGAVAAVRPCCLGGRDRR